jgi:hypothetical protein
VLKLQNEVLFCSGFGMVRVFPWLQCGSSGWRVESELLKAKFFPGENWKKVVPYKFLWLFFHDCFVGVSSFIIFFLLV